MKRTLALASFLAFSFLTVACGPVTDGPDLGADGTLPSSGMESLEHTASALSFLITNQRHDMIDSVQCSDGFPYVYETSPDTTVGPHTAQLRSTDFLATDLPNSNAIAIDCAPTSLVSNGQVFYNDVETNCGIKGRRAHGAFGPRVGYAVPPTYMQLIPADSPACPPGNPNGVWRLLMPDCMGGWAVKGWSF